LSDNEYGTFQVLVNAEEQHSLWPGSKELPEGWTRAYGPAPREAALEYVRANWPDLRPKSVPAG
jgi:MbtH protein